MPCLSQIASALDSGMKATFLGFCRSKTGSRSNSASIIGSPLSSGTASWEMACLPACLQELFTWTSACSGCRFLHSTSKGDFVVPRTRTAVTRQKKNFLNCGSIYLELSLPGCVLCHRTCLVLYINFSKLSS